MKLIPSSSARCRTFLAAARSRGGPQMSGPPVVARIAPNPMRLTTRSPSRSVPAAAAAITRRPRENERKRVSRHGQTSESEFRGTAKRGPSDFAITALDSRFSRNDGQFPCFDLLRLRHRPQIRLVRLEALRVFFLRVLV